MMLIRTRHLQVSRRGAFLALFGFVFILLGYSYLHIPHQFRPILHANLRFALNVAPIEFYGWAWITTGSIALLGSIVHRFDWVGFGVAILMPMFWSIVYFIAQIQDGVPRSWVSGTVYGLLAGAIAIVAGMTDPLDEGKPRRGTR